MDDSQKLLLENYKVLHESVQNSHRYSWTLTSIFIPLVFGAAAFLFEYFKDIETLSFMIANAGILLAILFWRLAIKFLENCNKLRQHQLMEIEKVFAPLAEDKTGIEFIYYGLFQPKKRSQIIDGTWIKYRHIVDGFAGAIVALLAVNIAFRLYLDFMAN